MNNKYKNKNNKISCENEFCVYQTGGKCILRCIELDNSGICRSCVFVDLQPQLLANAKQKHLSKIKKSN